MSVRDKMKILKNKSVFLVFLVSYIFTLIFPLLIGSFAFVQAKQILEDEIYRLNTTILERARNAIDGHLQQVNSLIYEISGNAKVNRYAYTGSPLDTSSRFNVFTMIKDFDVYKSMYSFADDFYIYFKASNTIITSTGSFTPELFYSQDNKAWDISYEEWYKNLNSLYSTGRFIYSDSSFVPGGKTNRIAYVQTLSIGDREKNRTNVVILVDRKDIADVLESLTWSEQSTMQIVDNENNFIASSAGKKTLNSTGYMGMKSDKGWFQYSEDGRNMSVAYITSMNNNWKYMYFIPSDLFLFQLMQMRKLVFNVIIVILVLGLTLACLFAYRSYSPIRRIVKAIMGENDSRSLQNRTGNEIEYIHNTILDKMREGKKLHEQLDVQRASLCNSFLLGILEGRIKLVDSVRDSLKYYKISLPYNYFVVLVLQIDAEMEGSGLSENFDGMLRNSFSCEFENYTISMDKSRYAILLNLCEEKPENGISTFSKQLEDLLDSQYAGKATVAVGFVYNNPGKIKNSYSEAVRALEYKFLKPDESILWYEGIKESSLKYNYPEFVEKQILNHIKLGESTEIHEIIRGLIDENLVKRQLGLEMMQMFLLKIINTAIKAQDELRVGGQLPEDYESFDSLGILADSRSIEEVRAQLCDVFDSLCIRNSSGRKDQNSWRIRKILEYIKAEYTRGELSLTSIADNFNITPQHLSNTFRIQTGESLNNYIQKLRINKAKELLENPALTIENISHMVGFNNYLALVRTFKKYEGITPGTYRRDLGVFNPQDAF